MTTAHHGTRHAPLTARLSSIDTLRGIVMILMALDHVRDFFGVPGLSPTNLAQTTVPLFFTRWITHLCAPTFFLLTGTGAFLALGRRTIPQLSRFLLTRGLWLVLLEVTVIRAGFQFNIDYQVTMLVVIWALGWAMIALAALCWLPLPAILAFGVAMIAGHNLLDGVRSTHPIWVMLHSQGVVVNHPGVVVFVAYPLVPWIGVTAVGFVLGRIYTWNPERRRAFLLRCGLGLTAAFLLLRACGSRCTCSSPRSSRYGTDRCGFGSPISRHSTSRPSCFQSWRHFCCFGPPTSTAIPRRGCTAHHRR